MADVVAPVFKKRANKASSTIRKRSATPPPQDSESDYTDDDEQGVRIKRRKTGFAASTTAIQAADTAKSTAYAADRSTHITANDDATKASNWYTDAALAAKESSTTTTSKPAPESDAAPSDGTYRGTAAYGSFIKPSSTEPKKSFAGPQKAAPTNVRAITVTDFAPDVCKDYKQTGFCGFGDSCKFLHAREDYKQGWQLDKEWESAGSAKKDKKPGANGGKDGEREGMSAEEKLLADVPFKCIICKSVYERPVVTKCGHYFCEKCAMGRYMREKKKQCANCGVDTGGSFGMAKKLDALLVKKREREERMAKEAEEAA